MGVSLGFYLGEMSRIFEQAMDVEDHFLSQVIKSAKCYSDSDDSGFSGMNRKLDLPTEADMDGGKWLPDPGWPHQGEGLVITKPHPPEKTRSDPRSQLTCISPEPSQTNRIWAGGDPSALTQWQMELEKVVDTLPRGDDENYHLHIEDTCDITVMRMGGGLPYLAPNASSTCINYSIPDLYLKILETYCKGTSKNSD